MEVIKLTNKIIALLLAAFMLFSVTACTNNNTSPETDTEKTQDTDTSPEKNYEGTLEDLMTAIYEKKPVELMLGPATAIDLENADNVTYFLGLSDASDIKEAVYSEPMMSAQAYSLCLVRVKEDADIDALKKDILNGINPAKWICVQASKVIVTNYGDVIALIMADDELSENLTEELYDAFAQVVDGKLGEKLED